MRLIAFAIMSVLWTLWIWATLAFWLVVGGMETSWHFIRGERWWGGKWVKRKDCK